MGFGQTRGSHKIPFQISGKVLAAIQNLEEVHQKSDFHWTPEAEQAFKQLKQHLSELPLLVAPKPKEELIVYLSASYGAVSAVLMTERGTVQTPVYFISRALQGPELNYTPMEKLVLSLVFAAKRLRRYFQAHPIAVITDQPIKQIMSRPDVAGRLQKWSVMLGEHNITYRPRTSVKGQILADFLVEKPDENPPNTPVVATPLEPWTLFTDGSSCVNGSGAGLILTSLEGTEFTYALRFQFTASNNEAEYEALIAGLRIAAQMGVQNVQVNVDSKLVANQVLGTKNKKADALSKMASTSFAHLSKKILVEILKEKSIQERGDTTVQPLTPITAPWPFYKWGIDIAGPFLEGPGEKVRMGQIGLRFGSTRRIISDNGKQFSDNPFKDWDQAVWRKVNNYWLEELPHVLWAHRTMIKSSHGDTPFSLTYGTEAVIPAEIGMPTYRTATVDTVHNDEELRLNLDLLEEKRERAAICEAKAKMKMTKYYNARVRGVAFRPGDFVYRSNDASHAAAGGKLGPKWEGPYEVTEALGDGAYKLRLMDAQDLCEVEYR
ncbi:reverse transcriptase domain-containing protein [Tanacetum coccineum]|uniref:Reverse transcriptase domain-containing protein n=1 Tax=Tanacetum coccineum TaxID=301880 RepID=A0ABQ5FQP9_9ASTR